MDRKSPRHHFRSYHFGDWLDLLTQIMETCQIRPQLVLFSQFEFQEAWHILEAATSALINSESHTGIEWCKVVDLRQVLWATRNAFGFICTICTLGIQVGRGGGSTKQWSLDTKASEHLSRCLLIVEQLGGGEHIEKQIC